MSISMYENPKIIQLNTDHTTYLIGVTPEGYVGHIYYGDRLDHADAFYLLRTAEPPFTPSVLEREKISFLNCFPMEYPTGGVGDYRESCLNVRNESGSMGCELFFREHRIYHGKPPIPGLPASFGEEKDVQTLEVICADDILGIRVILSYSVFEKEDIITRSVRVINDGDQRLKLEKVYSACLDMDNEEFEMLTLCGSWARERQMQRSSVGYGKQLVSSVKGESSHQEHPFLALVTPGTTQRQGKVYAMHFVYSGNFLTQTERTEFDQVRMTMGIHAEEFFWNLRPGESFGSPEVVLTFSDEGLGKMTRSLHDFYRRHLIRSPYKDKKRPILINNWEATYFDFNTEKLLQIAREAKSVGIEMLVMDDGWFGRRDYDDKSLGDWTVNKEKIPEGLECLVKKVNEIGLNFGIWFEPEMVSADSDLYRTHPEWAIQIRGRAPGMSRAQYVLDLSNPEVRDYVYESVAGILRSAPIAYVKWDMNRQLADVGSAYLDANAQGELFHRYVLGVYDLQERLVTEFPNLLLENCSGGGARFNPGMLYYSPQIWCSDDTDAVERLKIQEGTALLYPLSSMGAHVSDCPNHVVGRVTPFETRGHVALAGTFGYELDITKIDPTEKEMISDQIQMYYKYNDLIRDGDYYRLASFSENGYDDCWLVSAKDRSEALMTYVQARAVPNQRSQKIKLEGIAADAVYVLEETGEEFSGEILMKGGFLIRRLRGDAASKLYHFVKKGL